jgi:hypothetical protein
MFKNIEATSCIAVVKGSHNAQNTSNAAAAAAAAKIIISYSSL